MIIISGRYTGNQKWPDYGNQSHAVARGMIHGRTQDAGQGGEDIASNRGRQREREGGGGKGGGCEEPRREEEGHAGRSPGIYACTQLFP